MIGPDFIVTIHAFERIEERFPELVKGMSDRRQAELMNREVMDALDHGRYSTSAPLEFTSKAIQNWINRRPDSYFVWTQDKKRAYLVQENNEGISVVTVLARSDIAVVVGRMRRLKLKYRGH